MGSPGEGPLWALGSRLLPLNVQRSTPFVVQPRAHSRAPPPYPATPRRAHRTVSATSARVSASVYDGSR